MRSADPNLAHVVRYLIWANVFCWGILTIVIVVIGLFTWQVNQQHIRDSERIIENLCHELNRRNLDLKSALLDSGIEAHHLSGLDPISCIPNRLRNK